MAGLAAKPILDIQIALDDWSRFEELQKGMESLGYHWHPDNPDQRKRYFTLESNEIRLVNVHARRWGEFSAQAALLFRDYLRANRRARARYEQRKRELTTRTWPTIDDYADAKGDTIWAILREADVWGSEAGWAAGPSDA